MAGVLPERVEEVDLGVLWNPIGDPLLIQHLYRGALVVRPDPDDADQRLVGITIEGCHGVVVGPPNDEARIGHRLDVAGLADCAWSGEVFNSRWIEAIIRTNSLHPSHAPEMFADLRHWILLFKETTAECIGAKLVVNRIAEIGELPGGLPMP